nr:recombinase [Alphaproteobacteria bacterium]
ALDMFRELWEDRQSKSAEEVTALKQELSLIDARVGQFLDRIISTDSQRVITAYEQQIEKLESQKIELQEKVKNCGRPVQDFEEAFRTPLAFLANPHRLWSSDNPVDRKLVLRMVFATKLHYQRDEGFRTPEITQPFAVLQQIRDGNIEMAHPGRFELPTF